MALGHKEKDEGEVIFDFYRNWEVNFCTENVLEQTVLVSELIDNTNGKEYYQLRIHLSSRTDGEPK